MTEEIVIEVVQKLTGTCFPYGSTEIDEERLENLHLKMSLFKHLLSEIEEASEFKSRHEWSIHQIGTEAYDFLIDTKNWIEEVVLGETE